MRLSGMLEGQDYTVLQGDASINVSKIANDSRKVEKGSVFVAIVGYEQDGHRYIGQSIDGGAVAIVLEDETRYQQDIPKEVTVIKVKNGRQVLALMATRFYDGPSHQFNLIGVTGTNGKTTTVFLINNLLEYVNRKTGLIGTMYNKINKTKIPTERTTPESIEVKQLFYEMKKANVSDVVMEVSSHALDLHRVDYSEFDIGIFTNLTLDHLDYHKTMENYRDAKLKLFKMCKIGIINIDDPQGPYMIEHGTCEQFLTISTKSEHADFYAHSIDIRLSGVHFLLDYQGRTYPVEIQTPGMFSVYNALCAIAAAITLKIPFEKVIEALKENSSVKGRFQAIDAPRGYTAIVDYAHAPDGLENVLQSMKKFAQGRIITVFGCGGDRDRSKRPIMGKIAGKYSDYSIVTSDNPRTEEPMSIIRQVEEGIKEVTDAYECIKGRKEAIEKALSMAKENDLVLIAGKGHEDYQIIGHTKYHFDDEEIIREFIKGEMA